MERQIILSRLLDKYENSKHLLQPGSSVRRVMLRIDRKELPEYKYDEGSAIRDAYNNAAISLEKDGLVSVVWARPGRMSVIALNLPSLDEAYRRCGRQHPRDKADAVIALLERALHEPFCDWIGCWKQEVCETARRTYKVPSFCRDDLSTLEKLAAAFHEYDCLNGAPISMRTFSIACFQDSKIFERECRDEFLRIAEKYDAELNEMCRQRALSQREKLAFLGIYARPELFELSGNCKIKTLDGMIDLAAAGKFGLGLPSTMTDSIATFDLTGISRITFIENKTNYDECILSADAAIKEYENGIVKDFDHNLRLLRQALQKGDVERLRPVLTDDSVYETDTSGKRYYGPADIVNRFRYVVDFHEGKYYAHMAEITEVDAENMEFPVGTKCIVLAADQEDNYESIVFMTTDDDGNISRIKVSRDGRYHFEIKHPPRVRTPLDDIEVPNSVAEPIMARAKLHGFLGADAEFDQIVEDPYYSSHADNAKRMLDALQSDPQPDAKQAIDYILSYLFAKAVEDTVNHSRPNPAMETRLTASYCPSDAMRGELRTTLAPKTHARLVNDKELAEQFGNDLFGFMEMAGKTEDDFTDTFTQAAVIVQRIGQLYAEHGFSPSEGG